MNITVSYGTIVKKIRGPALDLQGAWMLWCLKVVLNFTDEVFTTRLYSYISYFESYLFVACHLLCGKQYRMFWIALYWIETDSIPIFWGKKPLTIYDGYCMFKVNFVNFHPYIALQYCIIRHGIERYRDMWLSIGKYVLLHHHKHGRYVNNLWHAIWPRGFD